MLTALRKRATYANVALTLALVFAMTGGAYAAKKYLITSTKQISPGVFKALMGKAGPVGAHGPVGPPGAQGPAGASGKDGKDGDGKDGVEGKAGATGPAGAAGAKGATGAAGPTGTTGSPWVAGGTLPPGSTETGAWSYGKVSTGGPVNVTASFAIPLATGLGNGKAHLINTTGKELVEGENPITEEPETVEVPSAACKGSATAPAAVAGNFCAYIAKQTGTVVGAPPTRTLDEGSLLISNPGTNSIGGNTGTTGARLVMVLESGSSEGWGTWAVTP